MRVNIFHLCLFCFLVLALPLPAAVIAQVDYFYADDGTLVGKALNGKQVNSEAGNPMVDELGYSFLFRDYAPAIGKWTTTDPLGYPDGWNNLAYVNNGVTMAIDRMGK